MFTKSAALIAATLALVVTGLSSAANAGGCGRGYGGGYSKSYQSRPSANYAAQARAKKLAAARAAKRKEIAAQRQAAKKIEAASVAPAEIAPVAEKIVNVVQPAKPVEVTAKDVTVAETKQKCLRFFPAIGERVEVDCETNATVQ